MAGAVFGEVEVSLFVAGAVFGEIWNDSRSAKCCIFQYKMLALEMTFQLFSRNFFEMLESHFAWQAQYLVMLEDATCCSAHCK